MALTKNQQNIVGGVIFAVAILIFIIWKFYMPMGEKIKKLESQLSGLDQKISSMKTKARQLDKLQAEKEMLMLEVQESQKQLPKSAEIDDLLRYITETAQGIGIFMGQFNPGNKVQKNYYTEIPITLTTKCTYHTLARFLVELTQSERIIYARNVKMNRGSEEFTISSNFTLVTFMSK